LFSTDFFVCTFLSLLARLRENGWTDLHEIFRKGADCGVTMGRPDSILGQLGETAGSFQHLSTLRENGWTDLHEIFREGVE